MKNKRREEPDAEIGARGSRLHWCTGRWRGESQSGAAELELRAGEGGWKKNSPRFAFLWCRRLDFI